VNVLDLNTLSLTELFEALTADGQADALFAAALREDLGDAGDVTSNSIIDADRTAEAAFVTRRPGIVSGVSVVPLLTAQLHAHDAALGNVRFEPRVAEGDPCDADTTIAAMTGNLRAMLALERTALNLLSRMSGIATLTDQYRKRVEQTNAVICDTRKTMPGMRALDKFAVRCGGGTLHRVGLFDAALYKDNHLAGVGRDRLLDVVVDAARAARGNHDLRFVEVEVDSRAQLEVLLAAPAGMIDIILLDNFSIDALGRAVALRNDRAPHVQLEASGGIDLDTVGAVAETGVDRISVGALTHSAPHLDIGLDISRE